MANSTKKDSESIAINRALSSWKIGSRATITVTESHLSAHDQKDTQALSVEDAERVLATHANDKESSENFLRLVEGKVEKSFNHFMELCNENRLTVTEISTTGNDLYAETLKLSQWLTMFTLGHLPGLNESGFMVADTKYSKNVYTQYKETCYNGQFVFPDLKQVMYSPESTEDDGIMCYYSEDAQKFVQALVIEKFRPKITPGPEGHMELRFGSTIIRKFVERKLSQGDYTKYAVISFNGLGVIDPLGKSTGSQGGDN